MNIPFLDNWRKRHDATHGISSPDAVASDPEGAAQLFSECELLRAQAESSGVELDDSADSLAALDQLLPRWRDDPEVAEWLGTDAGLYLGTVLVRTVPGAHWRLSDEGQPVVRLPSETDVEVLAEGTSWAETGTPELSQLYAEAAEG
ncbi:DUF6278 family protein [Streptomyces sp. HNM0574]|uniref:DUF6278 family protein n=1 Tax=Streptomyces sp. HNM0574 TaxID=2714954 RepID=UPI00146C0C01|nr:DUF6278 family protein [Streptomyces sp. HNM0574]NLU65985.1 hypothetical protein [Streptomyces sp. HNM0574]